MVRHGERGPVYVMIVVMVVAVAAAVLVLAPRLRTAPAGAQSAGDGDLLTELAERLLGTEPPLTLPPVGIPSYQGPSSPVQLLPGALPADLPITPPMPPGSTLIGSAERPSFPGLTPRLTSVATGGPPPATPSPAPSGEHVDVVLDVPGGATDIMSFYADAMARLGWSPPVAFIPYGPSGGGGFISTPAPGSINSFCQSADGPWLTVTVLPATSGPQDVRLALDTGNSGPCGRPLGVAAAPPAPASPIGPGLLPLLQPPAGVSVEAVPGGGGGPGRLNSDAVATTDMSPADLEASYEQELAAAGWARVDGASGNALAWSIWSIPDQSDWQGFLYVRSGPGGGRRALHVEAASASAQTTYGPPHVPACCPTIVPVPATTATPSPSTSASSP